jgi:hypothetical protein
MKPKAPVVSISVWKDLYAVADIFNDLRPWEILDDTDLIGVHDPVTGETAYGAYMGNAGKIFGFCAYRGAAGFETYRRTIDGEIDEHTDDFFAFQNCIMFELSARDDMMPEDRAVIKRLGLSYKGKHAWPQFRSYLPGYVPWFLTEAEARLMTMVLRAACHHGVRVADGEVDYSFRQGECLVYSPANGKDEIFKASWDPWPVPPRPQIVMPMLDQPRIKALLAKKPKPDSPWEADVFYLPSQIHDGERPFFAKAVAVCHQDSAFALFMEIAKPETPTAVMLANAIAASIEQHGFLPETVFLRRAEDRAALQPLAQALGIVIGFKEELPAIGFLKTDLEKRMRREEQRGRW